MKNRGMNANERVGTDFDTLGEKINVLDELTARNL